MSKKDKPRSDIVINNTVNVPSSPYTSAPGNYRPGDLANGHRLEDDGQWYPLIPVTLGRCPECQYQTVVLDGSQGWHRWAEARVAYITTRERDRQDTAHEGSHTAWEQRPRMSPYTKLGWAILVTIAIIILAAIRS